MRETTWVKDVPHHMVGDIFNRGSGHLGSELSNILVIPAV
jgi:hypothetical protein